MLIFIVLLAFVVDVGSVYVTRSQLQNAADAAALAAVRDIPTGGVNCSATPNAAACATARTYAASNGVPNALMSVVSPYNGDPDAIEVTTSQQVRFVFGPVIGQNGRIVTARAVATKEIANGGGYAIYAGNRVNFNGGGSRHGDDHRIGVRRRQWRRHVQQRLPPRRPERRPARSWSSMGMPTRR